ncbi:MAG: hypothetical protein ACOCXZ_00635 [Chloroflexota bacterium]
MAQQKRNDELNSILDFLSAPEEEYVIEMDCSDCDTLAALAEKVAAGVPVAQVLPALNAHLAYWKDCREEFEALVAVLKAEDDGSLSGALDEISEAIRRHDGGQQ